MSGRAEIRKKADKKKESGEAALGGSIGVIQLEGEGKLAETWFLWELKSKESNELQGIFWQEEGFTCFFSVCNICLRSLDGAMVPTFSCLLLGSVLLTLPSVAPRNLAETVNPA